MKINVDNSILLNHGSRLLACTLTILILIINDSFASESINGKVYYKEFNRETAIYNAKIQIEGTAIGSYTNELGLFCIKNHEMPIKGQLIISKFNFLPSIIEYDLKEDFMINIILTSTFEYDLPRPFDNIIDDGDSLKIYGIVKNKNNYYPVEGSLIRIIQTPLSTVTNNNGEFNINISINDLNRIPTKEFYIYIDKPGYEVKIYNLKKSLIQDAINSNIFKYDCSTLMIEKYFASSELDEIINQKISKLPGNIQTTQSPNIDSTFFENYNERISEIQKALSDLKADTQRYSQYREELVNARLNQNKYFELLKKEHELDSIYLLSLQFLDSAISSNNNSIKNLNAIDETIATSLSELGVDITSTRNDLNKRIEESIIVFNENARILNESYLKRSRQYDTTALQVFATIPVTLGPRYPDFVSTRTFGQIGINTNFGFHFLQRSKIYTSFSYNFLSFDNKDTNYHTGADNKTLFANTENVSANFFAFAVNFRPPIDFITNLKIDPGVGLSIGYDYKKIENGKINDSLAKIGIQAYIQVVVQYKLYTPPSDFNVYNYKSFVNNQNEFNNLLNSGQIDSSKYANKYKCLYENYNYKKSKNIKRRHIFQNLGHNTYLYFAVSDRLVFNEKKYLYGLANFSLGLKFDLSSFVKNQNLLKKSCELSDYCNPGKPSD
ncbi:MAG: hypothetical protein RBS55_08045 [Bacteroidales bacterium]|jgi:hypothetical protein|nr:hypothetical protein [Bacteroidales bacterium]